VPELEPLHGLRVVADAGAIDRAVWTGESVTVLRIAPDEALGIAATAVEMDDPDAIVEADTGFVGVRLDQLDLARVAAHTDWGLPDQPGALGQGKVAGVPVKILAGDPALLVVQTAYGHDLADRLGWLG
jgi:hypothetical protein